MFDSPVSAADSVINREDDADGWADEEDVRGAESRGRSDQRTVRRLQNYNTFSSIEIKFLTVCTSGV